jgi:hypothetical protein
MHLMFEIPILPVAKQVFWRGLVGQLGKEAAQSITQTITVLQLFSKLRILAIPAC